MKKFIAISKVDKNNPHESLTNITQKVLNNYHNQIVLKNDATGIYTCDESELFRLCLDDDELEFIGWDQYKQFNIDNNSITQVDIDTEKVKPDYAAKISNIRDAILTEVEGNPALKMKYNTMRVRYGKTKLP